MNLEKTERAASLPLEDHLILSEVELDRYAGSLREEIQNAMYWCRLLNAPYARLIQPGKTTAREFLKATYEVWAERGFPRLNPISRQLNYEFTGNFSLTFEQMWRFLPGEDYDAPIRLSDYRKIGDQRTKREMRKLELKQAAEAKQAETEGND